MAAGRHVAFLETEQLVKWVIRWLLKHLDNNNLLSANQSAYRSFQSMETVILWLVSDSVTESEMETLMLLSLLEMSSAFDAVDQAFLLNKQQCYDICEKFMIGYPHTSRIVIKRFTISHEPQFESFQVWYTAGIGSCTCAISSLHWRDKSCHRPI